VNELQAKNQKVSFEVTPSPEVEATTVIPDGALAVVSASLGLSCLFY